MNETQAEKIMDKMTEMSVQLARVEVLMQELANDTKDLKNTLRDHESRIDELESHKHATIGAKDVAAWLAIAGIMVWEVLAK